MPRLLAALIVIILSVLLAILVFRAISRALHGRSEAIGKVLATVIIAAAAYTLFGQGFLFGYLN